MPTGCLVLVITTTTTTIIGAENGNYNNPLCLRMFSLCDVCKSGNCILLALIPDLLTVMLNRIVMYSVEI